MGDMRDVFEALKEESKKKHDERVAKNPDRIEYAIQQFEKNGIRYELKNEVIDTSTAGESQTEDCISSGLEPERF